MLSHLVIRLQLFYEKINKREIIKKINNNLAMVASQIPVEAVYDKKCMWKVKKVPFLGMVMGKERVEMEENYHK